MGKEEVLAAPPPEEVASGTHCTCEKLQLHRCLLGRCLTDRCLKDLNKENAKIDGGSLGLLRERSKGA